MGRSSLTQALTSKEHLLFSSRDICPVLKDCNALRTVTDLLTEHLQTDFPDGIDAVVGKFEQPWLTCFLIHLSTVVYIISRKYF